MSAPPSEFIDRAPIQLPHAQRMRILILSAIASGQIVSRTGRYRTLIFCALVTAAVGLWLLSNLRADTPIPMLWLWMFITGLGVGPTFAVFTLIVQNSVPVAELGAATSGLTFFQQVGGTVGLAITGTIFASTMTEQVPQQLATAQLPPDLAAAMSGSLKVSQIGVGDLGAAILAGVPEAIRAQLEPFIPAIVAAIHQAFSIATSATFTVGVVTSAIAAGLVLLLREAPVREAAGAVPSEVGQAAAMGGGVSLSEGG